MKLKFKTILLESGNTTTFLDLKSIQDSYVCTHINKIKLWLWEEMTNMFRVINLDIDLFGEVNVIAEVTTLEKAKQISSEYHYFNTSVEQMINGKWTEVLLNGMNKQEWKEFGAVMDKAWDALNVISK